MRRKKLLLNTITAFLNQLVTFVSAFLIPRLIIEYYGSETNGLISSITQFLAFFSMMEMGVGAVVRSALYKPIADKDYDGISKVLISSKRFFNKIGLILCIYTAILMIYFPVGINHSLGYISTAILVASIAVHFVANYFLGIIYRQLLSADQKAYIHYSICVLTTILNTIASIVLIKIEAPIEFVKLAASVVLLINPLLMKIYVDYKYDLNLKIEMTEEPLKQKWNGLAQHIATYVLKHSDIIILTWLSTLKNVSVYYVYHLVTNGLQQIVEITTVGVTSLLGEMYAKQEKENLYNAFSVFELIIHMLVTLLYGVAIVIVIPFVSVYTKGISDTNYILPCFAIFVILANGFYCLRIPYHIMIQVAGHFKETQKSSFFEALLKVGISVVFVYKYGLIGVAFGTLVAMFYRTIYLAWYLQSNILYRPFKLYLKRMIMDIFSVLCIWYSTKGIALDPENWGSWIFLAINVTIIAGVEIVVINWIVYKDTLCNSINLLCRRKLK